MRPSLTKLKLFVRGSNCHGALGTGSGNGFVDVAEQATTFPSHLTPLSVSAGWTHSAALSTCGRIFVTGRWCGFRQNIWLGHLSKSLPRTARLIDWFVRDNAVFGKDGVLVPVVHGTNVFARVNSSLYRKPQVGPVATLRKCERVVCGACVTASIDSKGRVFTFGDNMRGQCGVGRVTRGPIWPPELVRNLDGLQVVDVALGLHHGIALTNDGSVRVWGDNGSGQLGTGNMQSWTSARSVPFLEKEFVEHGNKVVSVAAGMNCSAFCLSDGKLCVVGKELSEELDHSMTNPKCKDIMEPKIVSLPEGERALQVACSLHSILCLTTTGRLFALGRLSPELVKEHEERRGNLSWRKRLLRKLGMKDGIRSTGPLPAHVRDAEAGNPLRHKIDSEIEVGADREKITGWGETRFVHDVWEMPAPFGVDPDSEGGGMQLRSGIDATCVIMKNGEAYRCELGRIPKLFLEKKKSSDVSIGWLHECSIN
eukprot:g3935.t1